MCDYISDKLVKIRKPHNCWGCTELFPIGTNMVCVTSRDMGDIQSGYWCDKCLKIPKDGETCFLYGEFIN